MTPEELYAVWAPADSMWSPWVIPVPFAQLVYQGSGVEEGGSPAIATSVQFDAATAVVVDLPGGDAVRYGIALARIGFRPVAVFDGSPGPFSTVSHEPLENQQQRKGTTVVDMSDLVHSLCNGAGALRAIHLPVNAPPAFLLDSMRMTGHRPADEELFDNRWKVFPQDFPSAKFLREHGIQRVLLLQVRAGQPQEDLAHVMLRWQEGGLEIFAAGQTDAIPTAIRVEKPSQFRASWYRGLEILGLRRSSVGGFGGWPYEGLSG